MRQVSFAEAEFGLKKKRTRREKFLAEMEQVVPWSRLVAVIEPYYPKNEKGRPRLGLTKMLRLYFVQQWYGLADEATEDAVYDSIEKMSASKPSDDASLLPQDAVKTGVGHWLWDQSGRHLFTDPMTVGV